MRTNAIEISILFGFLTLMFLACEDFTKKSDKESEQFDYCLENLIPSPDVLSEKLIGRWNLVGFACEFGCTERNPILAIDFTENEGVLTGYYSKSNVINVTFTWSTFLDTVTWGPEIVNVPAARIKTEPPLYEVSGNYFCDRFMFQDQRIGDGYFMLFEKVD